MIFRLVTAVYIPWKDSLSLSLYTFGQAMYCTQQWLWESKLAISYFNEFAVLRYGKAGLFNSFVLCIHL